MQIIFKKKNASTTDRTENIDEGSTITENYNETLDSAEIRISHITSDKRLNIEPFDKVILHDENGNLPDKYMCIDTYTETMECVDDPYMYSYQISLFSETKELENIALPNLSITQMPNGHSRKIYELLQQYLDLYDEKIRVKGLTLTQYFLSDPYNYFGDGTTVTYDFVPSTQFKNDYRAGRISDVNFYIGPGSSGNITNLQGQVINIQAAGIDVFGIRVTYTPLYATTLVVGVNYKLYDENHYHFTNKHSFKEIIVSGVTIKEIEEKFNMECPEMQWNNPTLREVLTDLMMVKDCIPVVRNNIIDYIDLTQKKDEVDTTKVNYIQRSQSSEDYVSELRMEMKNVMQTSINNVKNTCCVTEYIPFLPSDGSYVVTSKNIVIKTQLPILNVKHLWMVFPYSGSVSSGSNDLKKYIFKLDLCALKTISNGTKRLLYEYSEYSVLPVVRYEPTNFSTISQNIALYFTRGSNIISGFDSVSKQHWLWGTTDEITLLKKLMKNNCRDINNNLVYGPNNNTDYNPWYSTFFEIEYETQTDSVFQSSKDIAPSHQRIIVDNQTNAYVDAYNQGFMEYQKANRLGNQQLYINARYEDDFEDIIKIGDYYEDSVVYQTTYQIYKHHIEVNAVATKDYILRDYFTGVKARVRSWKIAEANDAFLRHDLQKYYLEFSKKDKWEDITLFYDLAEDFMSPLFEGAVNPILYCGIVICTQEYPNTAQYYVPSNTAQMFSMDLIGRIVGNSIVFNFGFDDNYSAGKVANVTVSDIEPCDSESDGQGHLTRYVLGVKDDIVSGYGGVPVKDWQYTDDNGECYSVSYYFATNINQANDLTTFDSWTDAQQQDFMFECIQKPVIKTSRIESYIVFENQNKLIYKDNREILRLSTQFEVCSDSHDIVFTRKFLEQQKYIRTNALNSGNTPIIKIYVGSKSNFDYKHPSLSNTDEIIGASLSSEFYEGKIAEITIDGVTADTTKVYYITDASDNILLAVVGATTFYLNVLLSRDYNIYDTDGNVIGSI